jgi:quercetin dioxygenase-like cupin family protein
MKIIILASLLSAMCIVTSAQDPVTTSPQFYKVLLDNDQVRVLEYRLKPGEKEPMHSHPAGVVYVLSGATLKFSYPGGRTEEKTAVTGEKPAGAIQSHGVVSACCRISCNDGFLSRTNSSMRRTSSLVAALGGAARNSGAPGDGQCGPNLYTA